MAENLANDISTTLNGAIADGSTTSITVTSGTGFPAANFRIRIENEYMLVTSVGAGTNWTVTRGIESSTGVAHSTLTPVYHVLTTAGLLAYIQGNSGGAVGGGTDEIFYENGQTVTTNYTLTASTNAMTAGPISIDSGVTVTIPAGATWTVV